MILEIDACKGASWDCFVTGSRINSVQITVVYDNNAWKEGLETGWGFSCVVSGAEKTILFDTGGDSAILLTNMEKLGIDVNGIDLVVLSHIHGDHTGGLDGFLGKNPKVSVYLPESFGKNFKDGVAEYGAEIVEVREPVEICKGVHSVGRLGTLTKEQSLAVRTDRGLVVITGCAHPGIVKIVRAAKDLLGDKVFLVMGGFHLEWSTRGRIKRIISAFKDLGVGYVGPCHCSGDKARCMFWGGFGESYIEVGAGRVIRPGDLQ